MPAFTAVASYIVTAIVGIEGAAVLGAAGVSFLTSAVAVGLAATTSRLINGAGNTGGGGNTTQDPGVRIQLPPATNNKVPIVYGSAQTKGIVTDARISNENKTMTYVLVLSEQTQTGTFTIGDIFWNDSLLVFNSSAGSEHIVASSIDQGGLGTSSTNYANLIRVRVYNGGVDSSKQIFPSTGTPVNARTLLGESDTLYELNGLIFALVQVDYSSEKGTTGLGQISFQVNNSLKNPGLVWYDYMTSSRYGAGINPSLIDTRSCVSEYTVSDSSVQLFLLGNFIQDISSYDRTLITHGTPTVSYSRYKYNNSSLYFPTNSDYITSIDSGWNFGSDSFCIDSWVYVPDTIEDWRMLFSNAHIAIQLSHSGARPSYPSRLAIDSVEYPFSSDFSYNTWFHLAVTGDGSTMKVYLNGSEVVSTSYSGIGDGISPDTLYVGGSSGYKFGSCYLDNFRVTRGSTVFSGTFTPPGANDYGVTEIVDSASLYAISNQIPSNQYNEDGVTPSLQVRYEINGVLSTGDTIKTNIEKIGLACASWTTYDFSQGKWGVIVNRKALDTEKAAAFTFNDDNIIGDVGITATNLEDLYNILEVEFPSRTQRDQNDYYRDAISALQRNDLEPDNVLGLRVDMVNNSLHAARIGLIELKQSRVDLIVTFRADYSAIQCEAGDIIKVTNSIYGFNEKIFRITKLREVEGDEGDLTVEVTALAYDDDVYADESLSDFAPSPSSGIPQWGSSELLPAPSAPVASNPLPTASIPHFTLSTTISSSSGPVNLIEWFYSASESSGYIYLDNERSGTGNFDASSTVDDVISVLPSGTWYFKARTSNGSIYSDFSSASSVFTWSPANTAGSSSNADNIFVNTVTPGTYPLVMAATTGDYSEVEADSDLSWDATNDILLTNVINLSPRSSAPGSVTTGTIAVADRVNWDPAGLGSGSNYLAFYDGSSWIKLG